MPRALVIAGVLLIGVSCSSTSPPASARTSPSASAVGLPSPTPSPSPPPLTITSASFHAGELGFGYSVARPAATGGVPPYAWSVAEGALPGGLGMDSSGAITGTPGALGTFLFTVQVTDSGGTSATINTTINVVKPLAVSPTCPINFPCMVEAGCVNVCGGFGNLSGGLPPYRFRVVGGVIPTGMALSGFSLMRAFPAPAGGATNWTFTVRVTDGLGVTAQATAAFHVFPHIAFTQTNPPCPQSGTSCKATLTYSLGTPGLTSPPVSTTPVAKNLSAIVMTSGTVTFTATVPATCTKGQIYAVTVTLVLVDGSICGAGGAYCRSNPATVSVKLNC